MAEKPDLSLDDPDYYEWLVSELAEKLEISRETVIRKVVSEHIFEKTDWREVWDNLSSDDRLDAIWSVATFFETIIFDLGISKNDLAYLEGAGVLNFVDDELGIIAGRFEIEDKQRLEKELWVIRGFFRGIFEEE